MLRRASVAAAVLTVALAGTACAAGQKSETCALGKGRPVCCVAYVADHCLYVSCCETGNRGFFSATRCGTCRAGAAASACATSECEPGGKLVRAR